MESNVPLAPLTTFGIGGPAHFLIRVRTLAELQEAYAFAKQQEVLVFVLGGGSNVLFADRGFDGLVIKIEMQGVERVGNTLVAGAGEPWDALVARAVGEGLWGVENLSGIPGTVGGAVAGSIGAYGQAVAETLHSVEAYNTATGTVETLTNKQCQFGYRESIFSHGNYVVLRATFALNPHGTPNTSYKDLADAQTLDLTGVRHKVLAIRAGKFPNLAIEGTAGSFFKNPVIAEAQAHALQARYPGLPLFSLPEASGYKLPVAWVLDRVLHLNGHAVGGARLYERQPLVIAAKRGSSAQDVDALAREVEKKFFTECGIALTREVKIVL